MGLYFQRIPSISRFFIDLILDPRLIVPEIMENTGGLEKLQVLIRRLTEAERRAKLLYNEVKKIRLEIATLNSVLGSQQSLVDNNILGETRTGIADASSSVARPRQAILIDSLRNLPSTSRNEVDGSVDEDQPIGRKRARATFTKANDYVVVYTDGACENNGRRNAKAGIGVWFGHDHPLNISKPVEGKATNNTAEIQACVEALRTIKDQGETKAKILTDSQFTIDCITKWIQNWKRNNWKTASGGPVKNKEDLQKLDAIRNCLSDVEWCHVYGHRGVKGNEEADKLARQGALLYKPC